MSLSTEQKLVRVTAWIPQKNLKYLMKKQGAQKSQSQVLRSLVEDEVERQISKKAHESIYGIAGKKDLDESLF